MVRDDAVSFDDAHLDVDVELPELNDAVTFPDVYVGLEIDLLAPGDGIVTDRHHRYFTKDVIGQIESLI